MTTRRALMIAAIALGVVGGLAAVSLAVAHRLMLDRRALLLASLESETQSSATAVARLVAERARAIRTDLKLALEVARHARRSAAGPELARTHLIALDRSNKHYLRLWYVQAGEVQTEVSGFRADEAPPPEVEESSVLAAVTRARASPGLVASNRYESGHPVALQLFALADERAAIVLLVSMESLFDSLQRRARLPGTNLWVVDADGTVLVDPEGEPGPHRRAVIEALSAEVTDGSRILGQVPSPWPLGRDETALYLAWRATPGPAVRWTTGIAAPLDSIRGPLHETAAGLFFMVAIGIAAFALVVASGAVLYVRQRQLRERVQNLSTVLALREQLVRLERMSTVGQIAANVAHEIGTPLGVVSIRLDQMRHNAVMDLERERIDLMKEQIDRIGRIMRQLLDFSRPRVAGPQPIAVRQTVERVVSLLEHRLHSKKIAVSVDITDDDTLVGNVDELQQVLLNLLVNAADACAAGGTIRISFESAPGQNLATLDVHDDGVGIPPASVARVFEPFFTSKGDDGGAGLGLTIVREIVERHGGRVELRSEPGSTHVSVSWPTRMEAASSQIEVKRDPPS